MNLFDFAASNLRLQARQLAQEQQNLEAAYEGVPEFRLTVSEVDRLAALEHDNKMEARVHFNTVPNRKTD